MAVIDIPLAAALQLRLEAASNYDAWTIDEYSLAVSFMSESRNISWSALDGNVSESVQINID